MWWPEPRSGLEHARKQCFESVRQKVYMEGGRAVHPLPASPTIHIAPHFYLPTLSHSITMKFAVAVSVLAALAAKASPVKRQAQVTDTDILNYALTLEYLEE